VADVQQPAEPGHGGEDVPQRFLQVLRGARVGGAHHLAAPAGGAVEQVGMRGVERVVRLHRVRLDGEDPRADAVARTLRHGVAQLGEAAFVAVARPGEGGADEVAVLHREPQAVHALVGEAVEVFGGVVVDVVHQLVAVEGRALDGAEEAAGDAVAQPGRARGGGEVAGGFARLEVVGGPADAVVVFGRERDVAVRGDVHAVAFGAVHLAAREGERLRGGARGAREVAREVGGDGLKRADEPVAVHEAVGFAGVVRHAPGEVLAERPGFAPRGGRRRGGEGGQGGEGRGQADEGAGGGIVHGGEYSNLPRGCKLQKGIRTPGNGVAAR